MVPIDTFFFPGHADLVRSFSTNMMTGIIVGPMRMFDLMEVYLDTRIGVEAPHVDMRVFISPPPKILSPVWIFYPSLPLLMSQNLFV